jgi:hypothetical protein
MVRRRSTVRFRNGARRSTADSDHGVGRFACWCSSKVQQSPQGPKPSPVTRTLPSRKWLIFYGTSFSCSAASPSVPPVTVAHPARLPCRRRAAVSGPADLAQDGSPDGRFRPFAARAGLSSSHPPQVPGQHIDMPAKLTLLNYQSESDNARPIVPSAVVPERQAIRLSACQALSADTASSVIRRLMCDASPPADVRQMA